MSQPLDNDIKFLTGVGEARANLLRTELGIRTVGDLLRHYPYRYIDRTRFYRIGEIRDDSLSYIQLRARITGFQHAGGGAKKRFVATVSDGSGTAELVWFKGIGWIEKQLEMGREYIIFGRPAFFNGSLSLVHPEVESTLAQQNRPAAGVQGVYSTTEKLNNKRLGTKAIYNLVCNAWALAGERIAETLPQRILEEYRLPSLRDALHDIHFPANDQRLKAAELRLKFEELFGVQLVILADRQQRVGKNNGFLFTTVGEKFNRFYSERLPFPLTGAQKRVIREIRQDTATGHQMNRLLQGDVGSGKTLVALMSMLIAVDNGFQACLMAPTEILAAQHFATISRLTEGIASVRLLTGSTRKKERTEIASELLGGTCDILIGTHALIEEGVQFRNLGFVVIDEQHRFGVEQRAKLWLKNDSPPHVLVMTATPIPRTLAMTLYGDLDVSVIDELPPGRKPVRTVHYHDSHRLRVFGFIRDEIKKGRQVYIVYPLIKESEKMDYKDLEDGYAGITQAFPPPEYVTVVVHGKMKPADKEYGMNLFKSGTAQIMVATSVIEVGVDVPNDHGDRKRRAFRPLAAAPAPRPRGARRGTVLLHPDERRQALGGIAQAARRDGVDFRRFRAGRTGPAAARPGRHDRYAAERAGVRPEDREPGQGRTDTHPRAGGGRKGSRRRSGTFEAGKPAAARTGRKVPSAKSDGFQHDFITLGRILRCIENEVREIPVLPAMPSAPAAAKRASRLTGRPFQREGRLARRAAQVKIKGRNTPQTYKQTERCT